MVVQAMLPLSSNGPCSLLGSWELQKLAFLW